LNEQDRNPSADAWRVYGISAVSQPDREQVEVRILGRRCQAGYELEALVVSATNELLFRVRTIVPGPSVDDPLQTAEWHPLLAKARMRVEARAMRLIALGPWRKGQLFTD
jgi:hypothetical protein